MGVAEDPGGVRGVTKIYTRGGDKGETALMGGKRVPKADPRVDAYGEVDELNATLGLARASLAGTLSGGQGGNLDAWLEKIQQELFQVGAELATPIPTKAGAGRIDSDHVLTLERAIDTLDRDLPPLTRFILPGGSPGAAHLHHARVVCRRAERRVVALHAGGASVRPLLIAYLNRLSDFLYTAARVANQLAGVPDVEWVP